MKLVLEVSKTDEELNQLNKEIFNLLEKLKTIPGKEENAYLLFLHQLNENDISEYKKQIQLLESNIKLNSELIDKLKKENEDLKKNEKNEKSETKEPLNNLIDITKSFGINIISKNSCLQKNKQEIKKEEIPKEILEQCLKEKKQDEKILNQLKIKCNNYYNEEINQKIFIDEYISLIDQINSEIQKIDNDFNIKYDDINIQLNDGKKILDEICSKVENLNCILNELKNINLSVQNLTKFENFLNKINNNISKIDHKDYYNQESLKNILKEIKNIIEEIQNTFSLIDNKLKEFNDKNALIEKEIKELKNIQTKYKNENNKRNESIRQSLNVSNNSNNDNQQEDENEKITENYLDEFTNYNLNNIPLSETLLIKPKNAKEDLYKTTILFNKKQEENEYKFQKLIEKNWHEICYIYDDYDIYDVYYTLKAVGLKKNASFEKATFSMKSNCTIESFTINDKNANYKNLRYMIEFKINLKNLQTTKIHIKYKHFKNKDYSKEELKSRILNHYGYYGITPKTNTKLIGKFILILKGNFDIINFDDDFFIKNEKNDSEYIWGGLVPSNGKTTNIRFTRKKAKWNTNYDIKSYEINGKNVDFLDYTIWPYFFGGNNKVIDLKITSPQTKDIYFEKTQKVFTAEYRDQNKFELNYNIIFENYSKPGWVIDLTDEDLKNCMKTYNYEYQSKLKSIATSIIEDFDKKHKNSQIKYLDFMKIGEWVYKNIKYDLNYSGVNITPLEIYKRRKGVCAHFTELSNALLLSLGYEVLYANGYCVGYKSEDNTFNDEGSHAFSLIKIGNLWYPFDSTWGLFKGKVPITHVFSRIIVPGGFFSGGRVCDPGCVFSDEKETFVGKYIKS